MRRLDAVVYDLETARAICGHNEDRKEGVEYAKGWSDFAGMGVACLCAIDLYTGKPHVFLEDNLLDFTALAAQRKHLVGFNSIMFDDKVLAAAGYPVTTTYDLKVEAQGVIAGKRIPGRRLSDFARVNLGVEKPMQNHAAIPEMWQRGERGAVIDECMSDVHLLAELIARLPTLVDPVSSREFTVRPLDDTTQFDALLVGPARLTGTQHGND